PRTRARSAPGGRRSSAHRRRRRRRAWRRGRRRSRSSGWCRRTRRGSCAAGRRGGGGSAGSRWTPSAARCRAPGWRRTATSPPRRHHRWRRRCHAAHSGLQQAAAHAAWPGPAKVRPGCCGPVARSEGCSTSYPGPSVRPPCCRWRAQNETPGCMRDSDRRQGPVVPLHWTQI
ncbi:unnamed protein product, partial [Heterosigma akashiwo]